jgi:hypothetical protein
MNIGKSEAAETKTFKLSERLTVDITINRDNLLMEWVPDIPAHLTRSERRRYVRARDAMIERMAEITGARILVVEL